MSWLNTADYSPLQLLACGAGCAGWVVAYVLMLREIFRHGFVEMPAAAVVANVAWEFLWGFVFADVLGAELGQLFVWAYRAGCLLDLAILASVFRNGHRQLATEALRPLFRPALGFGLVAWTLCLYWFFREGYDNDYGAVSGYILNVQISALYIPLFLARGHVEKFSEAIAWWKFVGTTVLSGFNLSVAALRESPFFLVLAAVTLVLDGVYLWLHRRAKRGSGFRAASTP